MVLVELCFLRPIIPLIDKDFKLFLFMLAMYNIPYAIFVVFSELFTDSGWYTFFTIYIFTVHVCLSYFYNWIYINKLLKKGWKLADDYLKNIIILKKIMRE